MLRCGQKCARDNAALAVEPGCGPDSTFCKLVQCPDVRRTPRDSKGVSGSYNHPKGVAVANEPLGVSTERLVSG